MILNYSNYSKVLESKYKAENIDKKYYAWKSPSYNYGEVIGIIEIVSIINNNIKYKIIKRTGGIRDFFNNDKISDFDNTYKISLSYWKRNMYKILFSSNNKDSAITFYDTYDDVKKYNL